MKFIPKLKKTKNNFIQCNFSVRTLQYFQKILKLFFVHENFKNGPQKLLIIGPQTFFSQYCPAAKTSPELIFHIINMSQDSSVSLSVQFVVDLSKHLAQVFTLCQFQMGDPVYVKRRSTFSSLRVTVRILLFFDQDSI